MSNLPLLYTRKKNPQSIKAETQMSYNFVARSDCGNCIQVLFYGSNSQKYKLKNNFLFIFM